MWGCATTSAWDIILALPMGTGAQRMTKGPDLRSTSARERHALLQRVLWSHQIKNSERIRDFLVYVCERALQEPEAEIHEQEIGCRVFERKPDYDTAADNLVRVTASQARKKLEQYFASDGRLEPVVLEIPKGKYTPVFRERDAPSQSALPESALAPAVPQSRALVTTLAICALLFLIAAVWSTLALRRAKQVSKSEVERSPMVSALWSSFVQNPNPTDIVVADSSLSLFQSLLSHQLTLAEYLKPDVWTHADQFSVDSDLQKFAQTAARSRFTSLATVTAAYRIAQLLGRDQNHLSFVYPRDFSIRQMKANNVVLLGSTRANPWIELIQNQLNFRFDFDQELKFGYFENREPRSGELKVYRSDANVSYCQIAYLPNLSKTGTILAIVGTEVEGTEGGSEFVTGENSLAELRRLLPASRNGRFPYFDVLLRSNRFGGTAPPFSIVAVRALNL